MYIPAWLIIGAIILGIYFYVKSKKQNPVNNNMPEIFKNKFSYKLDIHIEPNWYKIYKNLLGSKTEKEIEKILEEKHKKMEEDDTSSLWGAILFYRILRFSIRAYNEIPKSDLSKRKTVFLYCR